MVLKECLRQVRCSVKEKRPEKECLKHKTILLNDNAKHYIAKKKKQQMNRNTINELHKIILKWLSACAYFLPRK